MHTRRGAFLIISWWLQLIDQTLAHAIIMAERATFGPFADFTSVCMRDRAFEQPVSFWIVYLGTLADDTV